MKLPRLAAPLLAVLLLGSCEEEVTYTYFIVDAKLDPATVNFAYLNRIGACAAIAATSVREDSADLRCRKGMVSHDLGKFEYTTKLTSGTIKFTVIANDFHQQTLARGETTVEIQPGKTITASVTALGIPGVPEDPNAPPDAGGSD